MKTVLKNGLLLDAMHEYERADILIEDDRIEAVGGDFASADAEVIDLAGMTLMPAFADAHVHVKGMPGEPTDEMLKALAYNGVSAVKDLGILDHMETEPYLAWLRQQRGPGKARVATAGRYIDVANGYGMGPMPEFKWGIEIQTPEEAAEAVRTQFLAGVDGIKIGLNDGGMGPILGKLSPEHVAAITRAAREVGIWTTAHVYTVPDLHMLIENGIGEAAHTPHDAEIDDELIGRMVEEGISMTSTIGLLEASDPLPERYPPVYASAQEFVDVMLKNKEVTIRNLAKFYKNGGTINLGTDLMHYVDPIRDAAIPVGELALLRNAVGMSMKDAIRAGTIHAARSCGFADEGMLRPGNKASVIAFRGKLSDSFAELRSLEFVMNQGLRLR